MSNAFYQIRHILFFVSLAVICGCSPGRQTEVVDHIAGVIDEWHRAAAEADEKRYLGALTQDARFLGTDATENWSAAEFAAFVHPYFSKGQGWTYLPRDRRIVLSARGDIAWFDERLLNDKYGELRGTGVLTKENGTWKIAHYSMSFPIPNDKAKEVVELVKERK